MTSDVEHFLGNIRRSLHDPVGRSGSLAIKALDYTVTAINEPFINEKLGDCVVLSRVGQGAMSIVYKARQDITDRIVAVKLLRSQLTRDPNNVKRFEREAKAVSRLTHPNLVHVYQVGKAKSGQPFMVMDFIEGRSLADVITHEKQILWQRAAIIFLQACDAMAHAHQHKIIHRDLKPENIMLVNTPSGQDTVKVVDFGIVKLIDESQAVSQRLTATGEIWGSPVYMSPEQCTGRQLDQRSDIYAMGITFYECLTGRQLFTGKRITDIIMKQLNQKPDPFGVVRPDLQIPGWLEAVVMKALEKEPERRFATMAEMRQAIELGLNGQKDTAQAAIKPGSSSAVIVPPSATDDEFINRLIGGKYLVQSKIGEGGMSVVYKAVHEGMNRPVAIKIIRDELCDDSNYKKRFQREAKALSSLSHPNLVSIYDVGTAQTGQSFIVMEYLDGLSMSELLDQKGILAPKRVVSIFIQICDVMNYLHQQGIIHRDLKPHNVMLVTMGSQRDFVKIVDFGILKLDSSKHVISQRLTATGDICGSPIYMSPEQILDAEIDGRSDIYALGIAMYESVMGIPPFTGKKVPEVLNGHINGSAKTFSQMRPDLKLPPSLETIVMRAIRKDRGTRYQSMAEVKQDLLVLQGRLEQEMTAVINGQPLSDLPPLPVAGHESPANYALRPEGRRSQESAPAGRSQSNRAVSRTGPHSSNRLSSMDPSAASNASNSSMMRMLPLALILAGAMTFGAIIMFAVSHLVPRAHDGNKNESHKESVNKQTANDRSGDEKDVLHQVNSEKPRALKDWKDGAVKTNGDLRLPPELRSASTRSHVEKHLHRKTPKVTNRNIETMMEEVNAAEKANLPHHTTSGDTWKGVEHVTPNASE